MALSRHKRNPEPQSNSLLRRDASCGPYPYRFPSLGDIIDAFQPITITWDPTSTCFKSYLLDMYLHDVVSGDTVHVWENVINAPGALSTSFSPAWWNMTSSSQLQLIFTEAGKAPWIAPAGPGPVFTARFNGSDASLINATSSSGGSSGPSVEIVSSAVPTHSGISGGKLAAVILFPILAIFGAIIGYVLYCRRQSTENSKRWSAYVDQRMSQIAGSQWEQGAVRKSAAHSRPGSTASRLATLGIQKDVSHHRPSMSSNRQSKVSFMDVAGSRHSQGMASISSTHQVLKAASRSSTSLDITTPAEHIEEPRALATPMHRPTTGNRGASNLRYEVGEGLDIQGAMSMIFSDGRQSAIMSSVDADEVVPNARNSRQINSVVANEHIADTASVHSTQASVSTGVATPRNNASSLGHGSAAGMRTLSNIRTSTLSPDEALKAYTMSRSQGPSTIGSPSLRSYASTIAPASPVASMNASSTLLREESAKGPDRGLRLQTTPMLSESHTRSEELVGDFGDYEMSSPQLMTASRPNNLRGQSIYTEGSRYSMISDGSGGPGMAR